MSIIIFIIILLVLVIVHEFGHFFTAKIFGIRVDEFGFGFPPKLFGYKKGETEYSLNLFPIGGFVKIFGENPNEENINGPDSQRSFVNKAKYKQAIVLFAGVLMNFLLAWLLFSFGFASGLPTSVGSQPAGYILEDVNLTVISVLAESPADLAGLRSGDKIIYIGSGSDVAEDLTLESVRSFIISHPGQELEIGYTRGQATSDLIFINVTPVISSWSETPTIGIAMDQVGIAKLPILTALSEGMKLNWALTKRTATGLYTLIGEAITGKGSFESIAGPVGMVAIVDDAYEFGFVYLLSFTALISINLAIINLLPFPALDGGRLLFLLIEKIKGSPIRPKVANTANLIGFVVLMLLIVFVTYHDVVKLL